MKKEIPIFDSTNKYIYWLIFKFTLMAKGARLIPERLAKLIIEDNKISQKKDLLTEILYNCKAVLA